MMTGMQCSHPGVSVNVRQFLDKDEIAPTTKLTQVHGPTDEEPMMRYLKSLSMPINPIQPPTYARKVTGHMAAKRKAGNADSK